MIITKLAGQIVTGDTSFFSILAEEGFGDGKPIEAEIITKWGHREPFQLQLPRN